MLILDKLLNSLPGRTSFLRVKVKFIICKTKYIVKMMSLFFFSLDSLKEFIDKEKDNPGFSQPNEAKGKDSCMLLLFVILLRKLPTVSCNS